MATKIAPIFNGAKCPSSISGMFGTRKATFSPFFTPCAFNAPARLLILSENSLYVYDLSLYLTAGLSGYT